MLADWVPGILMLVLFALGTPIAFAIAISALSFFLIDGQVPLNIFVQKMVSATDSYPLLAIPFFVLAGAIMNRAGITRKLLALADALVGHMTGALAQMCTVLATLLGGLTASSSADAAMLAKILGPEMTRHGYSPAFAAVITSCSAIITALIPPSIGLIIYAYIADASVGRLFIGGVIPGLLLAGSLMVVTAVISKKRGYLPLRDKRASAREVGVAFREAIWALTIPVFIIVGIRYGIFTPTEAGAITVIYVILVGLFAYRSLNLRDVPELLKETALDTASVMLMICAASAFGFYLAWERIPPQMAAWLVGLTKDPTTLLLHGGRGHLGADHHDADLRADPDQARHRPGALRRGAGDQPDDRGGHATGGADDVHQFAGAEGADGRLHRGGAALPRRDAAAAGGADGVPADHAVAAEPRLRAVSTRPRRRVR